MKSAKKFAYLLWSAAMMSSCADEMSFRSETDDIELIPISFTAAYPTLTRASDAGFEDGDAMGVYVLDYNDEKPQDINEKDVHAANILFRFNETENVWSGQTNLYWTSKETPADIIGYYPYMDNISNPSNQSFSIERRQDVQKSELGRGGYEKSDLLWAKADKAMPSDSRINLTFRHLMAGVKISLIEGSGFHAGEWGDLEKSVQITNIKPTVFVNLETGDVGEVSGNEISICPYQYASDWRAVVTPQIIPAGSNVIDVTVDGISYHLIKEDGVEYLSGKLHSFTITVNKRENGGGYELNLSDESIQPWIDDIDFRDGIVRTYLVVDVPKRGTLQHIIESMNIPFSDIRSLKLTGEINDNDFEFMKVELSSLSALNIENVTCWDTEMFVNGGWDSREVKDVIPEFAMSGKSTLTHLVLPKSVKIIKGCAFSDCGLIGSLILPEGLVSLESYSNWGGSFSGCKSLVGKLELPSTLENIGLCSFYGCNFTGSLNIPSSVKAIGDAAFAYNNFSGELFIPSNIESLGESSFAMNKFSGELILPPGIKTIPRGCFQFCDFSGTVFLPEGIVDIGAEAFEGCAFRGELKLPASLRSIGDYAFASTKISSVVIPDNIVKMGDGVFLDCLHLRGVVKLPKKIERLCKFMFCGCSQLAEVVFPENLKFLEGGVFYGCTSLNKLVCNNMEPPICDYIDAGRYHNYSVILEERADPFFGLAKSNFTLEVPKGSVDLYRAAKGWKEFLRISQHSDFVCSPAKVCALNGKYSNPLVIYCDGDWEVEESPEWCTLSARSGFGKSEMTLTINEMPKGYDDREAKIVFRQKGTDITSECMVSQYDYQYAEDECLTLQTATKGEGIDVLFVGDGWDAASIADGSYLELVDEQMEAFFGIEPFSTYRDYFNVYACISLSQDTGMNTSSQWRNTRFSSFFTRDYKGIGSIMLDDVDAVFDYAVQKSPLKKWRMSQSLIIMTVNSDEYGSSTILTDKGSAVAICCSSPDTYPMDTRGIIQHEACGHAFGKLAEERATKKEYIGFEEMYEIRTSQDKGWFQNVSLSGKNHDVSWSELIFDPRYSNKVDIFEGAYNFSRGVYRAEVNSCMNYGIPYFSAPARLDIMRRILEYSGEGFTMEKFYATDSDKWGSTGTTRAALPDASNAYVNSGMHHPVRIVKSKKY